MTTSAPPLAPPPAPPLEPRRAGRDLERGLVGGVAAGLADHLGLPVLWLRIGFVVATVLGGLGAVLYGAYWLFLPAAPSGAGPPPHRDWPAPPATAAGRAACSGGPRDARATRSSSGCSPSASCWPSRRWSGGVPSSGRSPSWPGCGAAVAPVRRGAARAVDRAHRADGSRRHGARVRRLGRLDAARARCGAARLRAGAARVP
ncbi:PspC domain-containing protein [Nocardioides zeae]